MQSGGTLVSVEASYQAEIRSLKLHERGGLREAACAHQSPSPRSRVAGRESWLIELPESERRIHLRPVAHGGLLRRLTGRRLLGPRRPLAELEVTAELLARGVAVPNPVLVVAHATRTLLGGQPGDRIRGGMPRVEEPFCAPLLDVLA